MTNGCQASLPLVTSHMQNGHHTTSVNGYHTTMNGGGCQGAYGMVPNGVKMCGSETNVVTSHGIFTGSSGEIIHHHQTNGMMGHHNNVS